MKSYLVTVTVCTRVCSDKDLTRDENDAELWRLAGPRLSRNLNEAKLDNLSELTEDEECPFDPKSDVEFIVNEN